MNVLAALRRAAAFHRGAAIRQTKFRHLHLNDSPLIITMQISAGEQFAPLALCWGSDPDTPAGHIVIPEPRDRTLRYQYLERFAVDFCRYIDQHRDYEMVVSKGSKKPYPLATRTPQIIVPNHGVAQALTQAIGRGPRYAKVNEPVAWCSAHISELDLHLDRAGQSLLMAASTALATHWASGHAPGEDENLAALLAWITPGQEIWEDRLTDIAKAERHAWGHQRDPDDDKDLIDLVTRYNGAASEPEQRLFERQINDAVLPSLVEAYRGTHTAIELLRALPAASSVAQRHHDDLKAWGRHVHRCHKSLPDPPRFTAVEPAPQAMRSVVDLEQALARTAAQMAYDDPMILAGYIADGTAFTGQVTAVDTTHQETKPGGKQPTLVPLVTLRTTNRPPRPVGTTMWWAARRTVKTQIRSVTRTRRQAGDPPQARPRLVQIALLTGHQNGQTVPAVGTRCTLAALNPNPAAPPRPKIGVPLTHR